MKHLEDLEAGQVFTFRTPPMTKEEIVSFAEQWDPQRLHTDEHYATTIHGGLIASGFQTLLFVFRPVVGEFLTGVANIGGLGFERLSWNAPVHPNEPLDVRMEMLAVKPSRSKPDRGVISYRIEASNPAGDVVMSVDSAVMIKRRGSQAP